jgi:hypothetical protein
VQIVPSLPPLQLLAPAGGAPHVPRVCPCGIVQTPPQQSGPFAHTSPSCVQNDDAIEQCPETQSCEQQSPFCAHALPDVLHDVLSAVHVPLPPHTPPQHCALLVHAWPSETHAPVSQRPATQASEQHWSDVVHAAPARSQITGAPPRHVCAFGSHDAEQQSVSTMHDIPSAVQEATPPSKKLTPFGAFVVEPPHPAASAEADPTTVSAANTYPHARFSIQATKAIPRPP